MNFYIEKDGKTQKVTPGVFYADLEKQIKEAGIPFDSSTIPSAVQFILKKEPMDNLEENAEKGVDIIRKAVEASLDLERDAETQKEKKASQKAEKENKKVEELQAALVDSENFAVDFRNDTELSISSRIAEAVGANFDVNKNGGLSLKKGAKLEARDAFVAIQGLKALSEAGNSMKSKSALALADVLGAVDKVHGEDFYAQLMDEKSSPLMRAAKMIANSFPEDSREKLDPNGKLSFSAWQELAGKKGLNPDQRGKLAKFAASTGASKDSIRSLVKSVSELPEGDRDDVIKAIGKTTSAEAGIELVAKYNQNSGRETNEKVSHLYITIVDKRTVKVEVSNDWNEEMSRASHGVVVLGSKPKFTLDNLALEEIKFVRTAPVSLPDGLEEGTVSEVEIAPEDEVYADIRIHKKEDGSIWATGTVDGAAQDVKIPVATSVEEGLAHLKKELQIGEDSRDKDGSLWNIRTD